MRIVYCVHLKQAARVNKRVTFLCYDDAVPFIADGRVHAYKTRVRKVSQSVYTTVSTCSTCGNCWPNKESCQKNNKEEYDSDTFVLMSVMFIACRTENIPVYLFHLKGDRKQKIIIALTQMKKKV